MKDMIRLAALCAALVTATLPLAIADDGAPTCQEAVQMAQAFFAGAGWEEFTLENIAAALDPVADACPTWATFSPTADLAASAAIGATNAATAPTFSTFCASGSQWGDNVPILVTFKVGATEGPTFKDIGPATVKKGDDGVTTYSAQGYVFGIEANSLGTGRITAADVGIVQGHATVHPLCFSAGTGTCGGDALVESNTDRVSVTGKSTFMGCQ